ncbi:MAG: YlmH/Sll1252 family protein [Oscillospiraceae bacterium]
MEYFKSNINNFIHIAKNKGITKFTNFLDENQCQIAISILNKNNDVNYKLFGGACGCERKVLAIYDSFCDDFPIVAIKVECSLNISHRECLGTLMGLNIKREFIGDIIIKENVAIIFILESMQNFLLSNLYKIGKNNVQAYKIDISEIKIEHKFEEITGTVASPRLDCIVAMLISKSRSDAVKKIQSKTVKINQVEVTNIDKKILGGEIISIKGFGKFIINDNISITKKERYRIIANKYID